MVCALLRINALVALCAIERDVGSLSIRAIMALTCMVARNAERHRAGHRGTSWASTETWRISELFPTACDLFQCAVKETWTKKQCEKLTAHVPLPLRRSQAQGTRKAKPSPGLMAMAVAACPKDAAKCIYKAILANDDPMRVANHVRDLIDSDEFVSDIKDKNRKLDYADAV